MAVLSYLSQDRLDVQYSSKEACQAASAPTTDSVARIKRASRYLLRYPRLVWAYPDVDENTLGTIRVWSDSDWGGCPRTRKSTSGGAATLAGGLVKSWSSTQKCIALSVGEAEYIACTKAAAEGIHLASLLSDLGVPGVRVKVCDDSFTAKYLAERSGLGGARHMDIRLLWLQACVKKGGVSIQKVMGIESPQTHSLNRWAMRLLNWLPNV